LAAHLEGSHGTPVEKHCSITGTPKSKDQNKFQIEKDIKNNFSHL